MSAAELRQELAAGFVTPLPGTGCDAKMPAMSNPIAGGVGDEQRF